MMRRCECPDVRVRTLLDQSLDVDETRAATHAAGYCPGTKDLRQYRRGEEVLWLCSMCITFGDTELIR